MDVLGVGEATLTQFGAVSEQCAKEMATGALARGGSGSGSGIAIAITGIAGPGDSDHKPEGRVCFAIATSAGARCQTQEFGAIGRDNVRGKAVLHGLDCFY